MLGEARALVRNRRVLIHLFKGAFLDLKHWEAKRILERPHADHILFELLAAVFLRRGPTAALHNTITSVRYVLRDVEHNAVP